MLTIFRRIPDKAKLASPATGNHTTDKRTKDHPEYQWINVVSLPTECVAEVGKASASQKIVRLPRGIVQSAICTTTSLKKFQAAVPALDMENNIEEIPARYWYGSITKLRECVVPEIIEYW